MLVCILWYNDPRGGGPVMSAPAGPCAIIKQGEQPQDYSPSYGGVRQRMKRAILKIAVRASPRTEGSNPSASVYRWGDARAV